MLSVRYFWTPSLPLAPNEGRNWCHLRLRDFDFETYRDFFRLQDQKTSGAMAPVAPPSSAPLIICNSWKSVVGNILKTKIQILSQSVRWCMILNCRLDKERRLGGGKA